MATAAGMQAQGLEWLHRAASEPERLWKRPLVTNTQLFVPAAARQRFRAKVAAFPGFS